MFVAVAILLVLRALMAALLPLSADEAYYLLWSKHLAAGYFDHPPAIAFLIRAGTSVFGDTPLGVRASGILLSLLTSWFVWQTAASMLKDEAKAAWAALFFNLTPMAGVEMLAATPDQPSIATVAAFLWCLAKLQDSGNGRWFLAAGAAAGLSLLSKYSMLFVGLGTLLWLLADPRTSPGTDPPNQARWLKTLWPWAGGVVALLVFAPNLLWQAQHDWMTFAFQFGRVGHGAFTGRYLLEFLGAQLGLATPLILVLAAIGFWQARAPGNGRFLLVVVAGVALAYFLFHALRDRVQGNWPCFLYPALAILAADANVPRWLPRAAAPLAALMLLAIYLQAAFGIVPLRNDPVRRLLARDFPEAAQSVAESSDGVIVTTDYETTALLRYYRPDLSVIQVNEPWRYLWAPMPGPDLLKGQVVYFVEKRREQAGIVGQYFSATTAPLRDGRDGVYESFLLENPKQASFGKLP